MEIRPICIALAMGAIIGALLRWETPGRDPAVPSPEPDPPAVTFLAALPDLGNVPPPPPLEEVLEAEGSGFLEGLVLRVAVSGPSELDTLVTLLKEQDRLSTVVKDVIFLRWMEIDPAGGLIASRSHGTLRSAYWAWAKIDAERAMAAAREELGPAALSAVLRAIGQGQPDRALELIEALPDPYDSGALGGILDGLNKHDPERAVAEAIRLGESPDEYLQTWLRKDPKDAFAWLREHGGHDGSSFAHAMDQLLQSHPDLAPELIETLPEGNSRILATIAYASHLSYDDPDAALDMIAFEPPGVRDEALGRMAGSLAGTRPEAALALLAQVDWENPPSNVLGSAVFWPNGSSTSGETSSESPGEALAKLVDSGHRGAIEFLESLPPSERSESAYNQIVRQWLERDSMGAATWLDKQPSGPLKDTAISSMTSWLIHEHPHDFDGAARWALVIQDAERRSAQLHRIYSRWRQQDPDGMRTGLLIPEIPESIIDSFEPKPTPIQR